ncbi:flagellar biosynthetic protein FliR [Janthinobacterium sp. B9-8]|uniref:flagellar biosynthetic protein FliR n=1 Tax=Janthinobacterium sp. B9-8 TaxID=1236179 RepID=UPI00061CE197|nr:flagellar biosynthetic protein FliR [Janthinobacterium sp. B9-8]AMC36086.1 flagellar biosynthetic protein FliR [Janthinobacterium sp. B9-8]
MDSLIKELLAILPLLWWPFCRYMAGFSFAPLIGEAMVPVRARISLSLVLSVITLPIMQKTQISIDPFSMHWIVATFAQVIIGLICGMAFQLVMTILSILGFLISSQMGLSMAVMNDPMSGSSSDVISTLLYLLGALLFFAMDGHLVIVQVIYSSFKLWPVADGINFVSLKMLAQSLSWVFAAALLLAIPSIFSTFIVQLGLGLLNRVAPALNLFSLGFPLITLFGLFTLGLISRFIPGHYSQLSEKILQMIEQMLHGGVHG